MALTIPEIQERLKRLDEFTLIEELNISSEDIVDRFSDIIEEQADRLEKLIDWED
jgi:hypothetical protein